MLYINKKNRKTYLVLFSSVINKTNKDDGEEMVVYREYATIKPDSKIYCRSKKEFHEKFLLKEGK